MGETKADILPVRTAEPRTPGAWVCVAVLVALAVVLGIAARFVGPGTLTAGGWGPRIAAVVAAAVLGTVVWAFWGLLHRTLTSMPFAVAVLSLVLFATMLGTFVLQDVPPEMLKEKYGSTLASFILGLGLGDLFHSAWFTGWLALLAASLVLVPVRYKAWRTAQWGHALCHLGIVLILAGCFVGVRFGFKGHIDLHEGQSADAALVQPRAGASTVSRPLGFSIRLVDFDVVYYPPEHRFCVYERTDRSFPLRKSVKAKAAASWTSAGASGVQFRVVRSIPASRQGAESHVLVVRKDDLASPEEIAVQPGATVTTADKAWRFHVLAYFPDFVIDSETRKPSTRTAEPNNPALQVEVAPASGGAPEKRWLFARMPEFDHQEGQERKGPRLVYRHTPAEVPAQIEVELRSAEGTGTHRFAEKDAEPLHFPDGKYILAYESKTDVKSYRSKLAVLEGERTVLEKTIEVNDPLSYGGYSFYQANFRKEDPTYSGLQVVRDPGLPAVWAGLIMLCAGVVYIYYVRPRLLRAKAAAPAPVN